MEEFVKFRTDTRQPSEPPPPKSCDCQVHVFGPVERYPTRAGASYVPPADATGDAAERMHRALGLERGVIVQATAYGTDNRAVVDALRGRPNYRGVAIVDDSVSDAELERLHNVGVRGARFNFGGSFKLAPSLDGFRRTLDRVRELGWFVKVFGFGNDFLSVEAELRRIKTPAIVDHLGGPIIKEANITLQ